MSIDGYSICRKDWNRNGGGIISYVRQGLRFRLLTADDVPSLDFCESEILSLLFANIPLIIVGVYHPFWNDATRNGNCIACISDLIDYAMVSTTFDPTKLQVALCGDFNGLHLHFDEISQATQLKPVVSSPTRGPNILDQIFVNFSQKCAAEVLPPFGKSDHSVVLWNVTTQTPEALCARSLRGSFPKAVDIISPNGL